jgi:hypothetical protein
MFENEKKNFISFNMPLVLGKLELGSINEVTCPVYLKLELANWQLF